MALLVLAHDGPEKGLLRAALSGLPSVEHQFAANWDEFMQALVASRPSAVILAHSTLRQNGDAGIKAADMTLRALNVPAVIALSHGEKESRFPIEMETEFEHFRVEPYGPKGLAPNHHDRAWNEDRPRGRKSPTPRRSPSPSRQPPTRPRLRNAQSRRIRRLLTTSQPPPPRHRQPNKRRGSIPRRAKARRHRRIPWRM